jgi:stage II sporulation protein R
MGRRKITRVNLYIAFALIMLIVSWESNLASAALMNPTIPEQSIRIRILANSDSVEDQWIKKEIRDAITANVNSWSLSSEQIEDARNEVNSRLPELRELVSSLLAKYDFTYGYQVELSKVHFPAKVFGHVTYPAGEYEALRVTLGEGQGQNWWCVLFPPLCFGSAIKATAAGVDDIELEKEVVDIVENKKVMNNSSKSVKVSDLSESDNNMGENPPVAPVYQAPVQDGADVEIKFFLVEVLKKPGGFIKHLWS